ncbi:hypothetical protein [Limnohabitans sp. Rim28]|uniref:hypothetical protein n=1 Tax=Limnohabitans sp. Rim28 TaxID=1100720 RepID=UPI00031B547A|nr:hypothetical protein [Limnohabitans sp. Rim28]PVE06025.1 hypothetical protein B472_13525 [Limnohabitans sp. Rim28]
MDALMNALMAIGLLVILVLIIYLIDRVSTIEKETRQVLSSIQQQKPAQAVSLPFLGMSSKKLWDAMTGRPDSDMDPLAIFDLQGPYQVVLSKHVEALYREGFKDGQRGMSGEPKNARQITTSAGTVESWIPPAQANAIYQCGVQAAQTPEANWGPLRVALDEAGSYLYAKAQLDISSPLSEWLMPSASGLKADATDTV